MNIRQLKTISNDGMMEDDAEVVIEINGKQIPIRSFQIVEKEGKEILVLYAGE
jgi:hypothetical protein